MAHQVNSSQLIAYSKTIILLCQGISVQGPKLCFKWPIFRRYRTTILDILFLQHRPMHTLHLFACISFPCLSQLKSLKSLNECHFQKLRNALCSLEAKESGKLAVIRFSLAVSDFDKCINVQSRKSTV